MSMYSEINEIFLPTPTRLINLSMFKYSRDYPP